MGGEMTDSRVAHSSIVSIVVVVVVAVALVVGVIAWPERSGGSSSTGEAAASPDSATTTTASKVPPRPIRAYADGEPAVTHASDDDICAVARLVDVQRLFDEDLGVARLSSAHYRGECAFVLPDSNSIQADLLVRITKAAPGVGLEHQLQATRGTQAFGSPADCDLADQRRADACTRITRIPRIGSQAILIQRHASTGDDDDAEWLPQQLAFEANGLFVVIVPDSHMADRGSAPLFALARAMVPRLPKGGLTTIAKPCKQVTC